MILTQSFSTLLKDLVKKIYSFSQYVSPIKTSGFFMLYHEGSGQVLGCEPSLNSFLDHLCEFNWGCADLLESNVDELQDVDAVKGFLDYLVAADFLQVSIEN